jgi:two-component system, OmpR family, sensor histidine kinase MtrB
MVRPSALGRTFVDPDLAPPHGGPGHGGVADRQPHRHRLRRRGGRWASGRSLRPLRGVSRAAVAIAEGRLGTRLAPTEDRDLAGLTGSFNRMVDQLQERIEREERFTSDVSHELRSPLTTLAASLDVLEAHAEELGSAGRAALTLFGADLRRFQRMVSELLEISRTDIGKADVVFEEVEVGELVRRSVTAASRTIARPAPEVEMGPDIASRRISVDKRRFERIVGNLLENAAHYGGGATAVTVEPGTDPVRPTVRISIDDQGPGIAPGERERVFERFYRGGASGRRGAGTGTGLGLSLVAEHVRLQGGRVWADEAPGGGARFTVELPADVPEPFDDEEELTAAAEPEATAVGAEAVGAEAVGAEADTSEEAGALGQPGPLSEDDGRAPGGGRSEVAEPADGSPEPAQEPSGRNPR